jgi:hypothetical protein
MPHCRGGWAKYLHPRAPVIIREVRVRDSCVYDALHRAYLGPITTHLEQLQVCPACAERLDAKAREAAAGR